MKKTILTAALLSLVLCLNACTGNVSVSTGASAPGAAEAESTEEIAEAVVEETQSEATEAVAEADAAAGETEAEPETAEPENAEAAEEEQEETAAESAPAQAEQVGGRAVNTPQRDEIYPVPAEYLDSAYQQGNVKKVFYTTHDYIDNTEDEIVKPAYVYLPYGYDEEDEDTRYNIFYYISGMESIAGDLFYNDHGVGKNLFDNMIEKGDMVPMIIVSLTYDRDNEMQDFDRSVNELMQFHQEFENDIMPKIETMFHTYAASSSKEDLIASRNHRAFGGFSLGSVTTWNQFYYNYDYISYFLPMSGPCWAVSGAYSNYADEVDDTLWALADLIEKNDLDERGYLIYACTATEDLFREQTEMMMEPMLERDTFFTKEHVIYHMKYGGDHSFNDELDYMYNGLKVFF